MSYAGLIRALLFLVIFVIARDCRADSVAPHTSDFVVSVGSISELRKVVPPNNEATVNVLGYYRAGDGGGGPIRFWSPESNCIDNGGSCIDPEPKNGRQGRWVWEYSGPVNALWFGAIGDFRYQTSKGTNNRSFIQAALNAAVSSEGTGAVFLPNGQYLVSTESGAIHIPEGVEFYGEGGVQTRRPVKQVHGTKLCIRGKLHSAFQYGRGSYIHNLNIDYPDQATDPITPEVYPPCFDKGKTSGARTIFENLIFDRCYFAFNASGGTFLNNVHGTFYRAFIRINNSSALSHITNCSSSAMWHLGKQKNTLAFQQDNLIWLEISGGADGLLIGDCSVFIAHKLISVVNGDSVNFFRVSNLLGDGVVLPLDTDGSVKILSMQFDNCMFRLDNNHGKRKPSAAIIINSTVPKFYSDRVVQFNNCRFRVAQGGLVHITGGGIDKFILNDCTVHDWNKSGGKDPNRMSIVHVDTDSVDLQIHGGMFDNFHQNRKGIPSTVVTFSSSKSEGRTVSIVGLVVKNVEHVIHYRKAAAVEVATMVGNTGVGVEHPIRKETGATVFREVEVGNNW
ncbi:MAG: hypothetical protein WBB19_00865 [Desulforhopalus sp.]